jgi:hypothetical protein
MTVLMTLLLIVYAFRKPILEIILAVAELICSLCINKIFIVGNYIRTYHISGYII